MSRLAAAAVAVALTVAIAADGANASTIQETPVTHQAGHPLIAKTYTPSASLSQLNAFLATVPGDGGESVLLPSGKVLWLFGDTLTGDQGGRNNYAIQTGARFQRLGELKPTTAAAWYWPGAAAMDGNRLVIFWGKLQSTGTGAWAFAQVSTVIDTYNPATLEQTSETTIAGGVTYQSAAKVGGSWYLYSTQDVNDGTHAKQVFVRRAGSLTDRSTWGAQTLTLAASWGAGTIVSVVPKGSGVQLWTKFHDLLTNDIVTATAPSPAGPFTSPKVVASPKRADQFTYAVYVHPEQAAPCLTYSTNGSTDPTANHPYALPL